jgi:triosephosphate isomerase
MMMTRKKIIAGNWKMNLSPTASSDLVTALITQNIPLSANTTVVIAPPFVYIPQVVSLLKNVAGFSVAAQDCHHKTSGAYTGDISASMIKELGCKYVILGHSERRMYHTESDTMLKEKVNTALAEGLEVIFCCGESLDIREASKHNDFVNTQINNSLFHLSAADFSKIIIAYEPIWAIGTGKTATPEQAQEMHANIRSRIAAHYNAEVANNTTILYGGSCNAQNAKELFAQPDIDGGLIGGAALKAADFATIITTR